MNKFIYLHGFASNPQSSKAQFFKQCFEQRGKHLEIPDLNQNDFYNLTLTRQIQQIEALLADLPTTLIGSSFGGLTALWLAERQMQIKRLVLLAPALNFLNRCATLMGESQLDKWRIQGKIAFEHYGYKREELLSYDFIEDMQQYIETDLQRQIPTLILHGNKDDIVPIEVSRNFAKQKQNVELIEVKSNHSLYIHDELWKNIETFCELS